MRPRYTSWITVAGYAIGHSTLETLIYRVTRRVDVIVEKFKHKVVAGVRDREILGENFIETLVISFFRRGVKLEEVLERLELHLEKVGIGNRVLYRRKIDTGFNSDI